MGIDIDPLVSTDPPPALTFTPMRPEDLDAVLDIERRAFVEPWSRGMFVHELKIPFSQTLVARPRGSTMVVGYVCRWVVGDEMQILNLAVHPAARLRGTGRALIRLMLQEAAVLGVRIVTLEVQQQNTAALALYRTLGFRESGVRRHYYGRGADAILMQCPIAHADAPDATDVDKSGARG